MNALPSTGLGRSVAALTSARLLGMASGFLVSVVGARMLGAEGVGSVGVAQTLGTLVGLIGNGGVTMATVYLVGRASGSTHVAGSLMALAVVSSIVSGLLTFVVCILLGPLAQLPPDLVGPTSILATVTVAFETFAAVLLGRAQVRGYIATDVLRSLSVLLLTVAVLSFAATPGAMVLGAAGGAAGGLVVIIVLLVRAMPGLRLRPDLGTWRTALAYGGRGQIGNVLQFVTLRFDTLLVAALAGPVPTGLYVVATKVSEASVQVANAGATLLFPDIARAASGGRHRTLRLARQTGAAVVASGLLIAVLAIPGMSLVFGEPFAAATPALWLLLAAAVPLSLGRVLAGHIKGMGHPGRVSIAASLGLLVTVAGDLYLIPRWGIEGAAFVSLVAYSATCLALWRMVHGVESGAVAAAPSPAADDASADEVGASARRPRICTLAFQGYGNVGDEAILCGMEALLGSDIEVVAIFSGPGRVAAFGAAPRVRTWKQLPTFRALRAMRQADALLMSGGGLVNDYWWPLIPRLLLWTVGARCVGRRVLWVGSGIGPIRRRSARAMAGLAFRLSGLIMVRDTISAAWVRQCPMARDPIVGVDPALFLSRPDRRVARAGVGIIGRMPMASDTASADAIVDAFLDLAAERAAAGSSTAFLSLDMPADLEYAARLRARAALRGLPPPELEGLPSDPLAAMDRLARFESVVTMRLHGLVLSALAGTPAVPIAYDPKVAATAERLGLEDLVIPTGSVDHGRLRDALGQACTPERATATEAALETVRATVADLRPRILAFLRQAGSGVPVR